MYDLKFNFGTCLTGYDVWDNHSEWWHENLGDSFMFLK